MSEPVAPIPEPSVPPQARVGKAYIDAIVDGVFNLGLAAAIVFMWHEGKLEEWKALAALGVLGGYVSVAQIMDRITHNRIPRSPVMALFGVVASGKGAAGLGGAAEVARRTFLTTLIALLPLVVAVQACATLRDINQGAREYCEATMGAEAAIKGMSVEDFCLLPYVIDVFLRAPKDATTAARLASPPRALLDSEALNECTQGGSNATQAP